jgi:hypothetical protein
VDLHDELFVGEGALAERLVVVVVPVEGLTQQVEAVQMVQAFDVGGVAAAVFGVDLDVVGCDSGGGGLVFGDDYGMIWRRGLVSDDERGEGSKHSAPRASHAASTSGPAGFRYMVSYRKDPLKAWTS